MDLKIEWSEPYKVKVNTIDHWRRTWLIPEDARGAFFAFWREEKFKLLKDGFRVYKEEDDWFLSETKLAKLQFSPIGITRKLEAPKLSDFMLPDYDIRDESGLRPWQVVAAGRLVSAIRKWNCAIDGSDTGVGKTYTACAAARDLGMNMVVVCPKAVISSWEEVIRNHFKMGKQLLAVTNYEQLKTGNTKLASYCIPREKRRKVFTWKVPKNTLIIWDECQKLKNFSTKNAKTCLEAHKAGYKQLFCSATNATNPMELRTVGTALKLFRGGPTNWYQWLKEHGCDKTGAFGSYEFTDDDELRKKVLKKLNKDIFLDRGVRLRRDTIPNFPQCDLFALLLDMDNQDVNKINGIYDEMEKELKELEKRKKLDARSQMIVELRHRQRIELVKVPLFIDMIEEAKDGGFSIVVFVNFTDTITALADRLGTQCIFDGKVGDAVREENKKRFQNNEEQVILVNVQSGGAGLSLHDLHGGHPRMALISPSYSPVNMRQAIGRIWRDDAKTKAIQKLVCVAHTVEENVYRNVSKKLNNLDLLNDGDLAYAKNYEVIHN